MSKSLRRDRKKRTLADINVVPYIDVMLVLLIIFMITAPLLTQGVNVHIPEAKAKVIDTQDKQPMIVSVDEQGNYFLNISSTPTVPMSPKQLAVRVAAQIQLDKQQNVTQTVYVKGDAHVDYGKVVAAMVMLQQAGASNIGLVTEPPDENNG